MDFWEECTKHENLRLGKSQEPKPSFRALARNRPNLPDTFILLSDGIVKILVPNINILSPHNVRCLDVTSSTLNS